MRALRPHPRVIAAFAWLAAFCAFVAIQGVPTRRTAVLLWIALAVLALGLGRPRATLRSFATTWLPLFGALITYDLLRGASDGPQSAAHSWPQLDLDVWLGGGRTPSERLQAILWDPASPAWWDYAAWGVYQSHFLVPLLVAVALWSMRHRLANRYVVGFAVLSWAGLATYWLYPAQPPWMTSRDGLTGEVTRVVPRMWADVGVERAARVFSTERSGDSRYANPVAALPSLHAAFPMFTAVLLRGLDRRVDLLLGCYVLAMGLTLVYAGEHFTFDIALGWIYAATIAEAARRYQRGRSGAILPVRMPQARVEGAGGSAAVVGVVPRSRYTARPQTEETRS